MKSGPFNNISQTTCNSGLRGEAGLLCPEYFVRRLAFLPVNLLGKVRCNVVERVQAFSLLMLRGCVAEGPASLFLFVNGGDTILLAEWEGTETTQEAVSTVRGIN